MRWRLAPLPPALLAPVLSHTSLLCAGRLQPTTTMSAAMHDGRAAGMEEELTVLRVVPDASLAEAALLAALAALELTAGVTEDASEFAQFVYSEADCWPSLLVGYGTAAAADVMITASQGMEPVVVRDEDRSRAIVEKRVTLCILREGDPLLEKALLPPDRAAKPRAATTLIILREWGMISFRASKERHLGEIAVKAAEGLALATGQKVELAQPLAQEMRPRARTGAASKRVSALGIWLQGKLAPPTDGLMYAGRGQSQTEVVWTMERLSFAPKPGSRMHATLSMPGWSFDRRTGQMVSAEARAARAAAGGASGSAAPPRGFGFGAGGSGAGGGVLRDGDRTAKAHEILPMNLEETRMLDAMSFPDKTGFIAVQTTLMGEHSVYAARICCFAVKYKATGKVDFACRPGKGCMHPQRGDGSGLLPCSAMRSEVVDDVTPVAAEAVAAETAAVTTAAAAATAVLAGTAVLPPDSVGAPPPPPSSRTTAEEEGPEAPLDAVMDGALDGLPAALSPTLAEPQPDRCEEMWRLAVGRVYNAQAALVRLREPEIDGAAMLAQAEADLREWLKGVQDGPGGSFRLNCAAMKEKEIQRDCARAGDEKEKKRQRAVTARSRGATRDSDAGSSDSSRGATPEQKRPK